MNNRDVLGRRITPSVMREVNRWHIPGHTDCEWMAGAACATHDDPDLWFPNPHTTGRPAHRMLREATHAAKTVCRTCPVRLDCLNHAIDTDTRWGIWGGATEDERAQLTGRRKQ